MGMFPIFSVAAGENSKLKNIALYCRLKADVGRQSKAVRHLTSSVI